MYIYIYILLYIICIYKYNYVDTVVNCIHMYIYIVCPNSKFSCFFMFQSYILFVNIYIYILPL